MMPLKDKEAKKAYHREYMKKRFREDPSFKEKHLERLRKNDARYRVEVEKLINEFRSEGCRVCKEKTYCCLVAHHLDEENKDFNIGDARRNKMSPSRVAKELEKCVCLCMNCHAKVHWGGLVLDNV